TATHPQREHPRRGSGETPRGGSTRPNGPDAGPHPPDQAAKTRSTHRGGPGGSPPATNTRNKKPASALREHSPVKAGPNSDRNTPAKGTPTMGVRGTPRAGSGGCAPRKHDEDRKQRRRPRVEQGGAFGRVEVPG